MKKDLEFMRNPEKNIDTMFTALTLSATNTSKNIDERQIKFKRELKKRCGILKASTFASSYLSQTFKPAVIGYLLNQPSIVYVQVHGILERASILIFEEHIFLNQPNVPKKHLALRKILGNKTLKDLCSCYMLLGAWDKSDEKKVINLIAKRNGIAHHNPDLVSKRFGDGKEINSAQIHEKVQSDNESHIAIIDGMELLYKLSTSLY